MLRGNLVKVVKLECQDCGENINIVEDYKNGYNVCGRCGCVLKDRIIDSGIEWRNFSDSMSPNKSRVGATSNPFLETDDLNTMITTGKCQSSFLLNKMQVKSYVKSGGKSFKNGMNLITIYCEQNSLSKTVLDRALFIFKTVEDKKLIRGKNLEGIISACLYIACKQEGCSRTFKEISVFTSVPKREVGKCYKLICKEIDDIKIFNTTEIIPRFCSELGLNSKIQNVAAQISVKIKEKSLLTGKSPDSVAGAVIFLVLFLFPDYQYLQNKIQNVTNVTDGTIRSTFKDIIPFLKEILPEEYSTENVIQNINYKRLLH